MSDLTEAVHLGHDDLPFVQAGAGVELKVVMVDIDQGLWIIRNRFAAGTQVQKHRHTGQVFGYTLAGAWKYAEYEYVNQAGSFLYEPAGSEHTLTVLDETDQPNPGESTDVWFQMYGSNLNLAADGSVESITDGAGVLAAYYHLCEAQGLDRPNVHVRR